MPKVSSLPIFSHLLSNFFSLLTCFIPCSVSPHPTLVFFLPCLLLSLFPHLSLALTLFLAYSLHPPPFLLPSLSSFSFPFLCDRYIFTFPSLSCSFHPSILPPFFPSNPSFASFLIPFLHYFIHSFLSIHFLPLSLPFTH